MLPRTDTRRGAVVQFNSLGRPLVLGVEFPSIRVAQAEVRAALVEQTSLAARLRLTAALVLLEHAAVDGCAQVLLPGLEAGA